MRLSDIELKRGLRIQARLLCAEINPEAEEFVANFVEAWFRWSDKIESAFLYMTFESVVKEALQIDQILFDSDGQPTKDLPTIWHPTFTPEVLAYRWSAWREIT